MTMCCICNAQFDGPGCNPEPFGTDTDRCCEECDDRFVVPVRMTLGRGTTNTEILEFLCGIARLGRFMHDAKHRAHVVAWETQS